MQEKRTYRRKTKRLEVNFTIGDREAKGISSDLSAQGLFIRTRTCLEPGSYIEFVVFTPSGKEAHGRGRVRNAVRMETALGKSGMGIELHACDENYVNLLSELIGPSPDLLAIPRDVLGKSESLEENRIVVCLACKSKNRVPVNKLHLGPRCGRCGAVLHKPAEGSSP